MKFRAFALKFCTVAGLPILEPFVRLACGEDPKEQMAGIGKFILLPIATVLIFLGLWSGASKVVVTGSTRLPGPMETWTAGTELFEMSFAQRRADAARKKEMMGEAVLLRKKADAAEKAAATVTGEKQTKLLALAQTTRTEADRRATYVPSSAPTFVDQIINSLKTVAFGFLFATAIAVPVGVLCGMNPWFNAAINPFVQIFKPVSPLAWLPLAGLVIIWMYSDTSADDAYFDKAFLISAVTVSLCSLWPTLVNTTLGVASVDKDYMNVAKVLKLSFGQQLFKIILPASLPLMFAGLRISLGVGWMVLIAADMLAQNPGLGKFVWDEFQNGSSQTYARIAFSVVIIGVIGLLLDRVMIFMRNLVSFGNPQAA